MTSRSIFSLIERRDASPAVAGTSNFEFLDRVAGAYWDAVRDLIETWATHLPEDAHADVRGRLRSRDDRQFNGAFFELYLHESLRKMGFAVTCHPVIPGTSRRPDFLAERDGTALYVEARSTASSDAAVGESARLDAVYASLNRVDSPNFFLWVDATTRGPRPVATRSLRAQLEAWLTTLDPDDYVQTVRREHLPRHDWSKDGWTIRVHAVPKKAEARGLPSHGAIGIYGGGHVTWSEDEQGLRQALADKGSAYGLLDAPYIVAIASSSIGIDDYDVLNALYGTWAIQVSTGPGGLDSQQSVRQPDGYWYAGTHWDHRHVSGVLQVKGLYPAFVGRQQHTLWVHPEPEHPVGPLPIWRRAAAGNDGEVEFTEPERDQAAWFALGADWPPGEAFPR